MIIDNFRTEIISLEEMSNILLENKIHLYQHPHWLKVVKEGLNIKVEGMITFVGSQPDAVTPFFKIKKGIVLLMGSPLKGTFTPYLGPVWLRDLQPEEKLHILESQHKFLVDNGASYIEWGFADALELPVDFGKGKYWLAESPQTLILNIVADEDIMWKKMESRARNMVRKAIKLGVKVERLKGTPQEISEFYQMLQSTFAKSGVVPPHPKSFYQALANILIPEKKLLFLTAKFEEKTAAFGFFPFDHKEIHYLSGASLPDFNKVAPNNIIQWEVIKFAVEENILFYDLGGIGISGIDKFKSSFGGEVKSYKKLIWMSPFFKNFYPWLLKMRQFLRKLQYRFTDN